MTIKLGDKVKDVVSGFTGRATGRAEYITGCVQFLVMPDKVDKEGKFLEGHWFDEDRLKKVPRTKRLTLQPAARAKKSPTGGPQSSPPDSGGLRNS